MRRTIQAVALIPAVLVMAIRRRRQDRASDPAAAGETARQLADTADAIAGHSPAQRREMAAQFLDGIKRGDLLR